MRGLLAEQFDLHLAVLIRAVPQGLRDDRPWRLVPVADRVCVCGLHVRVVGDDPDVTLVVRLVPASLALLLEEQPRPGVGSRRTGRAVFVAIAAAVLVLLLLPPKLPERLEAKLAVRVVHAHVAPLELMRQLLRLLELGVRARPGGDRPAALPLAT